MNKRIFIIKRIDGEHAHLADQESGEELFIALALLPIGADEGTNLAYENMEFSIIQH